MNSTPYGNGVFNGSSSSSSSSCSSSSDTLIADLDFLITATNNNHTTSTNNSRSSLNNHNQRYTNLAGNQRNIAHSNMLRPPPLTTPAVHTNYQHDSQHQHIEEDHQNANLYSSFTSSVSQPDQQNSSSLLETNLLISAQNCLANTDFSSFNNTNSDSIATAKNSIDLTNDLDSILLDTHAIGNNTANYFIESMQALHNLDTPHHLNMGAQSFTHLTSQGVPLNTKSSISRGVNNSTASSSSSASSSTANSSLINSSIETYDGLIQTPLDNMSNASSNAQSFLSKSHNFSDTSLSSAKKMKTAKSKSRK